MRVRPGTGIRIGVKKVKSSVALATYNGAQYIEALLVSILEQSCPVDEVVICDDCSRDNTVEIVRSFLQKHGLERSWRLICNETNLGFAENFRKAVSQCSGDCIFFCDQDDIWVKDRAEKMVSALEKHCTIQVLYTRFFWFRETTLPTLPRDETFSLKQVRFGRKTKYLGAPGCVMCVKREFFTRIEPKWFHGWAHDEAFWNFALAEGGLYAFDYISLYRREHAERTSGHVGHGRAHRIAYLETLYRSSGVMYEYCLQRGDAQKAKIYRKNETMANLRLRLVRDRKFLAVFSLLPYLKFYSAKRSYCVEALIALKKN